MMSEVKLFAVAVFALWIAVSQAAPNERSLDEISRRLDIMGRSIDAMKEREVALKGEYLKKREEMLRAERRDDIPAEARESVASRRVSEVVPTKRVVGAPEKREIVNTAKREKSVTPTLREKVNSEKRENIKTYEQQFTIKDETRVDSALEAQDDSNIESREPATEEKRVQYPKMKARYGTSGKRATSVSKTQPVKRKDVTRRLESGLSDKRIAQIKDYYVIRRSPFAGKLNAEPAKKNDGGVMKREQQFKTLKRSDFDEKRVKLPTVGKYL